MKLLKAYKPSAGSVTVGVVGYPNVGKSSLINSLKRSKVCAVAASAGHTKDLQSVQLERGMKIIDSPGVVFDDDDYDDGKGSKKGSVLLRNVVKVEDVEDPIAVVEEILVRTPRETLQRIYNLPKFGTTLEFLTMLALSSGRLLKGGTPDLNSAARHILSDWNQQKIPYFSEPPQIHPSLIPSVVQTSTSAAPVIAPGAEQVGHAQIVTEYAKPFELAGLFGAADAGAFGGDVPMDGEGETEDMALDEDQAANDQMVSEDLIPHLPVKRSRSPSITPSIAGNSLFNDNEPTYMHRQPKRQRRNKDVPEYNAPLDGHVLESMERGNPLNRKRVKMERKKERRLAKLAAKHAAGGMQVDDEDLSFTFMA